MKSIFYYIPNFVIVIVLSCPVAADVAEDVVQAAKDGDIARVRSLVDNVVDVNLHNQYGTDALGEASIRGHKEIVKLLLEKGVEIEYKDPSKASPLWAAASIGHAEIVKLLLENGADYNKQWQGKTPLEFAQYLGRDEIVRILKDASSNVKDLFQVTTEVSIDTDPNGLGLGQGSSLIDGNTPTVFGAHIKNARIYVHQNIEPFLKSISFEVSDPFKAAVQGEKNSFQNIKMKLEDAEVSRRKPLEGYYYVVLHMEVDAPEEDTKIPFQLLLANGKIAEPYRKDIELNQALGIQPPAWVESRGMRHLFLKKGQPEVSSYIWVVSKQDLEKGKIVFGTKIHPLSLYQ